jgi:cleavage and polyadenylation specificity factor subunit 1
MFSFFKTIHEPTGIDNSVYCHFMSSDEQNIITSSANLLQIYRLNSDPSSDCKNNKKLKLELVGTFNFYANISAITHCRFASMVKDALIIAFADAKLSIVEYDTYCGDLKTLSIHYFENEIEFEGIHHNIFEPVLRVDPNMKCAVMLIYGFKLVVIPFYDDHSSSLQSSNFNQETGVNKEKDIQSFIIKPESSNINQINGSTPLISTTTKPMTSSLSSYTIDLRKLDSSLEMRIIDIQFLYGYYEPTLYILSESSRTWVGRYAIKKVEN